jgi:hypothetical protein
MSAGVIYEDYEYCASCWPMPAVVFKRLSYVVYHFFQVDNSFIMFCLWVAWTAFVCMDRGPAAAAPFPSSSNHDKLFLPQHWVLRRDTWQTCYKKKKRLLSRVFGVLCCAANVVVRGSAAERAMGCGAVLASWRLGSGIGLRVSNHPVAIYL